jgi:hypothetical protein
MRNILKKIITNSVKIITVEMDKDLHSKSINEHADFSTTAQRGLPHS